MGSGLYISPFISFVCLSVCVCTFMCRYVCLCVFLSMAIDQRSKSSVFFRLSTLYFETVSHLLSLTIELDGVARNSRDPPVIVTPNSPTLTRVIDAGSPD